MRRLVILLIAMPMLALSFGPLVRNMMLEIASRRDVVDPEPVEPDYWKIVVETTEASQDFSVYLGVGSGGYLTIEWEPGTVVNYDSTGTKTHTFASAGSHEIKMWGDLANGGVSFNISATRTRLKESYPIGNVAGILQFKETFRSSGLRSLHPDLFRWQTHISANGCFESTFAGSAIEGSIPETLFKHNTLVGHSAFFGTFSGCYGLTGAIPENLFKHNTQVGTAGFRQTFYNCTGLTGAIPENLFKYNTQVGANGFLTTFFGCSGLTYAPAGLFKYNTLATSFSHTFYNCTKLQIDPNIFWDESGDITAATRFNGKTVDFQNFFRITSAHQGNQGTAPALWDAAGTLNNPADAFTGHSTDSLSNYDTVVLEGWATE